MDRREVMQAAGLGLAALAIPGWMSCQRSVSSRVPSGFLHDAWAAARAKGRPLFVLHAERGREADHPLGMLFGTFLLQASPEELAPLGTCELACATTEEFRQLTPEGSPTYLHAVVLWPNGNATSAVSGEPPALLHIGYHGDFSEQHTWLAGQLETLFHTDPLLVQRMAEWEREAIGPSPNGAMPDVEFARTWPCEALLRSRREPAQGDEWEAALTLAARERWKDEPPERSAWKPYDPCPPCGMAYFDTSTHRFLEFYTSGEQPR